MWTYLNEVLQTCVKMCHACRCMQLRNRRQLTVDVPRTHFIVPSESSLANSTHFPMQSKPSRRTDTAALIGTPLPGRSVQYEQRKVACSCSSMSTVQTTQTHFLHPSHCGDKPSETISAHTAHRIAQRMSHQQHPEPLAHALTLSHTCAGKSRCAALARLKVGAIFFTINCI
jgi:hypothetical protein